MTADLVAPQTVYRSMWQILLHNYSSPPVTPHTPYTSRCFPPGRDRPSQYDHRNSPHRSSLPTEDRGGTAKSADTSSLHAAFKLRTQLTTAQVEARTSIVRFASMLHDATAKT